MTINKEFKENKAVFIDEQNLIYFDSFLAKNFKRIKYRCKCSDETEIEFDNLNQVIEYENPSFRKIISIEVFADNESNNDRFLSNILLYSEFRIEFGGDWSFQTLKYRINSKELEKMIFFENELRDRIKDFRPWYWIISKTSFNTILLIICWGYTIINGFIAFKNRINGVKISSENINLSYSEWVFFIITSIIFFAGITYSIDKFKNYLFPKVTISLGKQKVRESKRKNLVYLIFGIIILTIIINLISNLIWGLFRH
jgi:hypothetical protein